MRRGSNARTRSAPRRCAGPGSALIVSSHWSAAAEVKKIEPTKKTSPSAPEPTSCSNPGNGPTKKHVEPIANRTPIHHDARPGAHQTPEPAGRESFEACWRWPRDDHDTATPSGRRQMTWVTNGPTFRRLVSRQPGGACGYDLSVGEGSSRGRVVNRLRLALEARQLALQVLDEQVGQVVREPAADDDAERRKVGPVLRKRIGRQLPAPLAHRVRDVEHRVVVDVVFELEREHGQL